MPRIQHILTNKPDIKSMKSAEVDKITERE